MDTLVESCWCCASCVEKQNRLQQGRSIESLYSSPTKTGCSAKSVLHGGGALSPEHLPLQPCVGGTPPVPHTLEMCRLPKDPGESYTNTSGHAKSDVGSPNHIAHSGHDPAGPPPLECLPPGVTHLPQYTQVYSILKSFWHL